MEQNQLNTYARKAIQKEFDIVIEVPPGPLEMIEWNLELIEHLAGEIIKWSNDDDSLVLGDFYADHGFSNMDAIEWDERSPLWKRSRAIAKTKIGARRERKGLQKLLDSGIVRSTLARYDPEQLEVQRSMSASLKLEQQDKAISFTVTKYIEDNVE